MPDFTIEDVATCSSNLYWSKTVKGSTGAEHTVTWTRRHRTRAGWECSCKGFQFRGTCRHIEDVKASGEMCGWNRELEPFHGEDTSNGCPKCGADLEHFRVAV